VVFGGCEAEQEAQTSAVIRMDVIFFVRLIRMFTLKAAERLALERPATTDA